ncbi:MAG TPA: amino acid adenylation domain-containing protein [Terracidiphilus sp.]|jgi:amino acid adenylation domain-containing protein|nr:amino acid adenylation domain-containing protein [Terracidiphilus sp.]
MSRPHHPSSPEAECAYPLERGPQEFIEDQVAGNPNAVAVEMGTEKLTFGELNVRANRLAHFLQKMGIRPEHVVGVHLERSIEMVVCLVAILKAGGVYLPLDPKFPRERLEFMLEDADVSILLTDAASTSDVPSCRSKVLVLRELKEQLAAYPGENPSLINRPQDLAYILYTSGSTGKPKGVMVPRRALVNFLLSMAAVPGMSAGDSLLAVTTISFDISFLEMLLPLVTGARLVVAAGEQAGDPSALKRLLDDHHITVMQATPTTWRMLVESGWTGKPDLKILCGGEALTQDLAENLLPRCRELWNMYGPTETTIWSSTVRVISAKDISLGPPIANTYFFVADESLQPAQQGAVGELLIGGEGLARGYLKREELTREKFVPDAFCGTEGSRLYRTGDAVRSRADGTLEFLGRMDHQVKLNGFRIELGEIETIIAQFEGVRQAVVIVREDLPGDKQLVAYYTGDRDLNIGAVLQSVRTKLPEYMVPSAFVWLNEFSQTQNGKLDRKALPAPARMRPPLAQGFIAPASALEKRMVALWAELLRIDQIGVDDNFFDLGGTSLAAVRMASAYQNRFGVEIPLVKIFQYPTVGQLCHFLEGQFSKQSSVGDALARTERLRRRPISETGEREAVAIVGMVGRFPGADNLEQLWRNLCEEKESISFFAPEEIGPGLDERLRADPDYVRARGIIHGAELFDAGFFGISPLEAKVTDPQQRVFLELAYQALENAGYDPGRFPGLIGVYAGLGDNHYYTTNLLTHPDLLAAAGKLAVEYGNQKDYIALRTAYLLDLRGPAVSLNTACSTTLIAVDQAYRALLDYECDMAIAGGVDITVPQKSGFHFTEGGTFTRDGHCRPFDADATGTMFCDGAGIVVLKRLSDAQRDGDRIYAVLLGAGKNNNGARPASFLAPSVDGQAEVIAIAQANAGIDIETIGYIEAHGTGTPVGDPIEIQALAKAFEYKTQKKQFCYVGSIKGNIGHPTNAAGVAGLIKAAMVLDREQIPATLHFKKPNPRIDFANSPFRVADKLIPFPRRETPRRAAVSSFGFGGTNAHVILGEAPEAQASGGSRPMQLLLLSARTASALDAHSGNFAEYFETASTRDFADAAFTLQTGRKELAMRRFVVAENPTEAAALLQKPNPARCASRRCERRRPPVVFLFGGQGTQYLNMGKNLYEGEPLFAALMDDCSEILKPHLGHDLSDILYPKNGDRETAETSLRNTLFTQPSIFAIEYSLARFWQSVGVEPALMAGHSVGEFVAATLAGVWSLEDALRIVALRGKLMQSLPRGSMMAVRAAAATVADLLPPTISIAANNAPSLCVVSGPAEDVDALRIVLEKQEIVCRPLHTSHAFHSAMMDPILDPLHAEISRLTLRAPSLPFVSTVTGDLIADAEATDPTYWSRHARRTVEFSKAVQTLGQMGHDLFLECGPRATMCALVRQHFTAREQCTVIPTLPDTHEDNREWVSVLSAVGSLWLNGLSIDWGGFYANENRRRIPLPNYPFERKKHWVDPAPTLPLPEQTLDAVAQTYAKDGDGTELSAATEAASPVPPQTREARFTAKVLEILVGVSGCDLADLSSSTTFLELGFDSLSLAQVAVGIERTFGHKVGFNKLMNQLPTAEAVAQHLDAVLPADFFGVLPTPKVQHPDQDRTTLLRTAGEQGGSHAHTGAGLERKSARQNGTGNHSATGSLGSLAERSAPTTVPQRGIFYSSSLSQNLSASYNESVTVQIEGRIVIPKLIRSLERLVERHEALRGYFNDAGSDLRIRPSMALHVPVKDISGGADDIRLQLLTRLSVEEAAQPFQLPDGPLFRGLILRLGVGHAAIVLTAHHVVCDGWSFDVLIQEFCALYSEELSGKPARLKTPPSFVDYAAAASLREKSSEFRAAEAYWRMKFADGFPSLVLPTDFPREALRAHSAKRVDRLIGAPIVVQLREIAAQQRCSLFAVTVAAFSLLLARISKQRRFILPFSLAEQPILGRMDLVGHCVSLLPYLVNLHDDEDLNSYLARVQRELSEDQEHFSYTTVHLLEDLIQVRANLSSPVPVGMTSVRNFRPDELVQHGFTLSYEANPKSFESFELYFSLVDLNREAELQSHFDTQLFKDSTIETWLADFQAILADLISRPSRTVVEVTQCASASTAENLQPMYVLAKEKVDRSEAERPEHGLERSAMNSVRAEVRPGVLTSAQIKRNGSSKSRVDEPGNSVEQTLAAIWARILNVKKVALHDNFFELGGHSLLAVRMMNELEKAYHIRLPLAVLVQAPTVAALAAQLRNEEWVPSWSSLVPIRPEGSRAPLFLMHSHGGNTLEYQTLANLLDPEQPVYALQARGLDGRMGKEKTIEEMAQAYLEELLSIQPEGPYFLAGFCFGGILAVEAARQLRAAGKEVPLVFMIQAAHPDALRFKPGTPLPLKWWYRFTNRAALERDNLSHRRLQYFGDRLRYLVRTVQVNAAIALGKVKVDGEVDLSGLPLHYILGALGARHSKATERYVSGSYNGDVVLFSATKQLRGLDSDEFLGWRKSLKGKIDLCKISGHQQNLLLPPNVFQLAEELNTRLRAIQVDRSSEKKNVESDIPQMMGFD